MPQKNSALSLKEICLQTISDKLELICYGVERTDPSLKTFLRRGYYENIEFPDSPLSWLPTSLLSELLCVTGRVRPCPHHVLYLLIQPNLTTFRLPQNTNKRTALRLLSMRCKKLICLEIPQCKVSIQSCSGLTYQQFVHFRLRQLLNWNRCGLGQHILTGKIFMRM